ncbi:hypothetical protein ACEWY4_014407 [Coilia grayii]|uniref:DUF7869 domain-containing protein n=1 Tax=Coilia grayii TaxID=363190 RepID=A0ABD1JS88_9TELE
MSGFAETPELPLPVKRKIKKEVAFGDDLQKDLCVVREGENDTDLEYDCKTEMDILPIREQTLSPNEIKQEEECSLEYYGHNVSSFTISCEPTTEVIQRNAASTPPARLPEEPTPAFGPLTTIEHVLVSVVIDPSFGPLTALEPVVGHASASNPVLPPAVPAPAPENGSTSAPLPPESTGRPPMREPCGIKCRRQCTRKIPEDRRREIWSEYWDMSYGDKRSFVFYSVSQVQKAKAFANPSRRSRSFIYRLKDADEIPRQVCKMFFLSTLGYHPANDSLVFSVMGKEVTPALAPRRDQRGRHEPANKLDLRLLYDHIESCHPTTNHYQREHAPCRRYLPSDVSIKLMYADYIEKGNHCSYETYRKAVKSKNISFTKLGEEECESCLLQNQHVRADHQGEASENCTQCERWQQHISEAVETRLHYRSDADRDWPDDTSVRSVDLQKIIMLPRMPSVKSAVFTRRISAYHETFAPVGKKTNKNKTISVVWHEGIAGRNVKEIASAYGAALEKERDIKHIVYWVDNCSAHNRNWCLLSSLVSLVNSDVISTEDITLKFFEPGHTFMSADSFHHGVEQEMRQRQGGGVYDFEDFVSVVANSNSKKVEVIELKNEAVRAWMDGHSAAKVEEMPSLAELKVIQLRRGSRSMFVKTSHEEEDFTELDFLQKEFKLCIPSALRPQDWGVEEVKKMEILNNLVPLMPPTKSFFWRSLTVRNLSEYKDEE